MSASRVRAATALLLAVSVTGCAQPALEGGTFTGLTPSATPTYGVPASDLRTVDLEGQLRADPRVPAILRDYLSACATCLTTTTSWADLTGDGRDDATISVVEDGTPYATVIFGLQEGRSTPIFIHVGRHGEVRVKDRDLVLTRSMYAASDAECCPSGPPLVSRFRWESGRFEQVSRTGGGPGLTTYDSDDRVLR